MQFKKEFYNADGSVNYPALYKYLSDFKYDSHKGMGYTGPDRVTRSVSEYYTDLQRSMDTDFAGSSTPTPRLRGYFVSALKDAINSVLVTPLVAQPKANDNAGFLAALRKEREVTDLVGNNLARDDTKPAKGLVDLALLSRTEHLYKTFGNVLEKLSAWEGAPLSPPPPKDIPHYAEHVKWITDFAAHQASQSQALPDVIESVSLSGVKYKAAPGGKVYGPKIQAPDNPRSPRGPG